MYSSRNGPSIFAGLSDAIDRSSYAPDNTESQICSVSTLRWKPERASSRTRGRRVLVLCKMVRGSALDDSSFSVLLEDEIGVEELANLLKRWLLGTLNLRAMVREADMMDLWVTECVGHDGMSGISLTVNLSRPRFRLSQCKYLQYFLDSDSDDEARSVSWMYVTWTVVGDRPRCGPAYPVISQRILHYVKINTYQV